MKKTELTEKVARKIILLEFDWNLFHTITSCHLGEYVLLHAGVERIQPVSHWTTTELLNDGIEESKQNMRMIVKVNKHGKMTHLLNALKTQGGI